MAGSTRSSATPSWRCSVPRSPTRTTPSGRCGPRSGSTRRCYRAAADLGLDVRLRVGVNTGEVLVGSLRAGGDYTAMGDVVNTAQRLQSAAEPGQVLVGQATYLATRRVVTYRSVSRHRRQGSGGTGAGVGGRGRPPPARSPVGPPPRPAGRPRRRGRAPVPHAQHGDRPGPARAAARARRRRVGQVAPGRGRRQRTRGSVTAPLVLPGRCVPYGEANVWWPVASAVQAACDVEPGDDQEVVTGKVRAAVAEALDGAGAGRRRGRPGRRGPAPPPRVRGVLRGIDSTRARDEVTGSLLAFTAALARRRPVVMVLSDLHWADEAVLDVVGGLLQCHDPAAVRRARHRAPGADRALVATGGRAPLGRGPPRSPRAGRRDAAAPLPRR